MRGQSDTDMTMTLLAWLVFHILSDHITSYRTQEFVFLLSILSFKWPMCNSQGNLTEPDDNFCAIGIVATTFRNTIYEGFSLMPMNFVIWSFTEQTASSIGL